MSIHVIPLVWTKTEIEPSGHPKHGELGGWTMKAVTPLRTITIDFHGDWTDKGVQSPYYSNIAGPFFDEAEAIAETERVYTNSILPLIAASPSTTPARRRLAYIAIDSERAYQDSLARNVVNQEGDATFSPMTNLAIIEEMCARMKSDFYDNPGHPSMDYMRKIAATAVRTMETFGAPKRGEK